MGKYLKLFNNHSEYTAFTQTEEFVKPNVSHCIQENEVHYNPIPPIWGTVDLGLSVKWAKMNVGATSETDNGLFFAWGETDGYTSGQVGTSDGQKYFGWVNNGVNDYKYANGASNKLTKYCNNVSYGNDGFTDGLITLSTTATPTDDTAYAASGGQYRMPTQAECLELASGTTNGFLASGTFTLFAWSDENGYAEPTTSTTDFTNTKLSGATGQVYFRNGVTAYTDAISSGEYLFLPACGYARNGSVFDVGQWGSYWSSFLSEAYPYYAWGLYFGADDTGVDNSSRCYGLSVRGVLNQ